VGFGLVNEMVKLSEVKDGEMERKRRWKQKGGWRLVG
jgi:hypothetical protein